LLRVVPLALCATIVLGLISLPSLGAAQESTELAERERRIAATRAKRAAKTKTLGFSTRVSESLGKAIELFSDEDYAESVRVLEKALRRRTNPLEKATCYRILAYARHAQDDTEGAIEAFRLVVAQQILPLEDENEVRFNIAQLHASLQQWEKTLATLNGWFEWVDAPSPAAYYFKALTLYQLERPDEALVEALRVLELSDEPLESWLQLVVALNLEKQSYADATPHLEELVTRFPKKRYWLQLALIYTATGRYEDSLAAQQLAYAQGLLQGIDEESVERDAESLELLANSYIAAREYEASMAPLLEAAELEETGSLYVRLGQVHIQREEWSQATTMLRKALEREALKDPGRAMILIGIAEYSSDSPDSAIAWFSKAREYENVRTEADEWIEHIERELRARAG
jgi:tetratricopeptide (TPR) repeat protein